MHEAKSSSAAPRELPDRRKHERPARTVEEQRQELHARIERDFNYYPPRPGQEAVYEDIRRRHRELAHFLIETVPPGRELSQALTALEQSVFHSNGGVARSESW